MRDTATLFTGVNEGYQGEKVAITDPLRAVDIVRNSLETITRSRSDPTHYAVYPGRAVYDPERGCPLGGEAVAAVVADGAIADVLATARELRLRLKQTTLAVGTSTEDFGEPTRGFTVSVTRSMEEVGAVWQVEAADYRRRQGVYVSCGVYDSGAGHVTVQAEANPLRFKDIAQWEKAAGEVAGTVAQKLGVTINPAFRRMGFAYLRDPGL